MARKKKTTNAPDWAKGLTPGTVEYAAREHFEREKAGYEERTGEKVTYVPPTPVTSTPMPVETVEEESEDAAGSEDEITPAEGVGEN